MTPVPKGTRYRYKTVSPTTRLRLAHIGPKNGGKVVEVTKYQKKNHKWVRQHKRRRPRKRK